MYFTYLLVLYFLPSKLATQLQDGIFVWSPLDDQSVRFDSLRSIDFNGLFNFENRNPILNLMVDVKKKKNEVFFLFNFHIRRDKNEVFFKGFQISRPIYSLIFFLPPIKYEFQVLSLIFSFSPRTRKVLELLYWYSSSNSVL